MKKTWDEINIILLRDGCSIEFLTNIPNTKILKGEVKKICSFSVWHSNRNVCMSFDTRSRKSYDIPYESFKLLTPTN